MKNRKYYTPAEFAKLFQIDRQTLIYYDNHGIFSPSLKNEKGYRYYSLDQVFRFAEILSLRNLSISGSRLSDYNLNPTVSLLKEILNDKIKEYEGLANELTSAIKKLKYTIHDMEEGQHLPLNQFMLIPKGIRYYQRSHLLSAKTPHREALLQSASFVSMYAENNFCQHLQFSFKPCFSKLEDLALPHDYHLILLSKESEAFSNPLSLPPSLYLTIILKNRFHQNREQYIDQLATFMNRLHMKNGNTFLITPIRNLWNQGEQNPAFCTKLELQVEYENNK